jgi:hypothetical protein
VTDGLADVTAGERGGLPAPAPTLSQARRTRQSKADSQQFAEMAQPDLDAAECRGCRLSGHVWTFDLRLPHDRVLANLRTFYLISIWLC